MSNYFNEAGEPLMDGSAMRYEMYLDSLYEPDPEDFYAYDDDDVECPDCADYIVDGRCGCDDDFNGPWVAEDAMMEEGLFGPEC